MRFKKILLELVRMLAPVLVTLLYGDFWKLREKCLSSKRTHGFSHVLYWAYLDHVGSYIGLKTVLQDVPVFPHGLKSIFISEAAVIGRRCVIFQQVVIGSNNLHAGGGGAPVIEDECYIGSGAKIIGKCRIGHNSRIGANCIVVKDMSPNTTAVIGNIRFISHDTVCDNSKW